VSSTWQQLIAALAAAVVPIVVKFFNDWLDTQKKTGEAEVPAS
jgi:quinol-cytochrome oxidoreductase complex cytochrome b subunit